MGIAFAESASSGGFGETQVLVLIVLGALALVAFVGHARRTDEPLIDPRLLRTRPRRQRRCAAHGVGVFSARLLYLQTVRGEERDEQRPAACAAGMCEMLMMPLAGQLADRTGIGRIVPVGLALVFVTSVALKSARRRPTRAGLDRMPGASRGR